MHIGLIGGIGPAATEFYYRNLVRAHVAAGSAMELTIVHADSRELIQNMSDNAPEKQAEIFLRFTRRLQGAGAEAVAVTSIAGHFCIREFEALSPLPVINAIPEIEAELVNCGLRRVGLLGTRVVMQSRLYGGVSAVEVVMPQGGDLDATHNAYIAMATAGQADDQQRQLLFSVGNELCQKQGAEAVVLAGTDLFLAFEGRECGFPTIDSARVHIDALVRESMKPSPVQ
ncbi:MAG TPA: aspartate/glutamate racemase family protein [Blastocatellia bacterium]|nr:aspartate/glutamate racemase family protein [Blastocatellia bacterium]